MKDERALKQLLKRFDMDREQLRVAVLEAIDDLRTNGWHPRHNSTAYNLVHDDRRFPPKEVLRRAFEIYTGEKWADAPTSGGDQTNGPLRALEFRIEKQKYAQRRDGSEYLLSHERTRRRKLHRTPRD